MEWLSTTVVVCAGALTIFNIIDKIVTAVKAAKNPVEVLEKRVDELERKISESYPRYDAKVKEIEEGNRVVQRSILALLKHSIDGNNIDALKKAENELSDYLIDK